MVILDFISLLIIIHSLQFLQNHFQNEPRFKDLIKYNY